MSEPLKNLDLPEHVSRLDRERKFSFDCGPGVECFNVCCRQLDLALSPYDVLRLRKALEISSAEFLDRYTIVELAEGEAFPQVYLAMVDDGQASCPFVTDAGCSVYADRPGACRAYPVGRAAFLNDQGRPDDFYVLLTEPHCCGFAEDTERTVNTWVNDQDLEKYNRLNDLMLKITHHPKVRNGFRPDRQQMNRFMELLYDLDGFRRSLDTAPVLTNCTAKGNNELAGLDDEALLRTVVHQLCYELFG
jgi:uncharacterized protein